LKPTICVEFDCVLINFAANSIPPSVARHLLPFLRLPRERDQRCAPAAIGSKRVSYYTPIRDFLEPQPPRKWSDRKLEPE